jgi:hypothetical protein
MQTILNVTTHGGINLTQEDRPVFFTVPAGIKIIKMSVVAPGVCYVVSPDDIFAYSQSINNIIRAKRGEPMTFFELQAIAEELEKIDRENVKGIQKNAKTQRRAGEPDVISEQFVYHADKSFRVVEYNEGEEMINKLYSRNDKELANPWDLQVLVMNTPGRPDLVREIKGRRGSLRGEEVQTEIRLEEMVSYLKERGTTEIVLFDFSCSIFGRFDDDFTRPDEASEMSSHAVSVLRRELVDQGKYGGRNKKTTRAQKKRTNKRRNRKSRRTKQK